MSRARPSRRGLRQLASAAAGLPDVAVDGSDDRGLLTALATRGFAVVRGGAGRGTTQRAVAALDATLFGESGGDGLEAARSACTGPGTGPGFHRYDLSPDAGGRAAERLAFRALPEGESLLRQRAPYAAASGWPKGMAEDVWGVAHNVWPSDEARQAVGELETRLSSVVDGAIAALDRAMAPWCPGGRGVLGPAHALRERALEAKRYRPPADGCAASSSDGGSLTAGGLPGRSGPSSLEALPVHSDLTSLTALVVCPDRRGGRGRGGLEVFDWSAGGWTELEDGSTGEDDVILNVGEFGSALTGGALLATPHRVVLRGCGRASAVLFTTPDAHTDLDDPSVVMSADAAEALVRDLLPGGRGFERRFYDLSPQRYGLRGGGLVGDHLPV